MKSKILIGIPAYGGSIKTATFRSLMRDCLLLMANGYEIDIIDGISGAEIDTIRNKIVSRLVADETASDLIFVDSDVCWDSGDLLRLMASNIDTDRDIVAGVYPKKSRPIEYPFDPKLDDHGNWVVDPDNRLIECRHVPSGFMRIPRGTAVHLANEHPELQYRVLWGSQEEKNYPVYGLFEKRWSYDEASGLRSRASEDVSFCWRVTDAGGTVYAHPDIGMGHIGDTQFTGAICPERQRAKLG